MIHNVINILLTLLLIQQSIVFFLKTNKEKLSDTPPSIYDKVQDVLKQIFLKQRDANTVYNPLAPPEQRIESRQYPNPNNNIFGERTRGEPDDYQIVGLLYNTDVNKNYQLYGRHIYPGSYEWEYYIRGKDAGGLDFKFPIQLNNKEEIRDGMQLNIPIDKNVFTVSIYNYDLPRYNPFPFN